MAMDERDWYKNLLRKKSGYTERAKWRASYADMSAEIRASKKPKPSLLWPFAYFVLAFGLCYGLVKLLLRLF
jgi:hypothetical protein